MFKKINPPCPTSLISPVELADSMDCVTDQNNDQVNDSENSGSDIELRFTLHRLQERMACRVSMVGSDLSGQQRLLDEIHAWTGRLDESVLRTHAQIDAALETFSKMVQGLNQGLVQTFTDLKSGLDDTRQLLDHKRHELETVLDSVGQIGKTIRMLSINAQIASAKAGEHGQTFSVVAQEIKGLANEATESSNEAVKIMDLADVEKLLANFDQQAHETLKKTGQVIESTQKQFQQVVDSSRSELDRITANSRIVAETLETLRVLAGRVVEKNQAAVDLSSKVEKVWFDEDPFTSLVPIMDQDNIRSDPAFDRLREIKNRGVIRIAIEPDFKGLSFRTRGGSLQGLDVEYARAFSRWLGVECQFVEFPWDQCTELLWVGRHEGEAEVDVMWSALPPSPRYRRVAYSDAYTYLQFVLARRTGDARIQDLNSLAGKTLGCINDPAALKTLEDAGVRWTANENLPGALVRLGNLITYSDQSRIHDCLADGIVDAFAVDRPIYYWACTGNDSPWRNRIELLPGRLSPVPWYYTAGVADDPSSYTLLAEINQFLNWYQTQPERRRVEMTWQGEIISSRIGYREEGAGLRGAPEIYPDYLKWLRLTGQHEPDEK